MVQGLTLKGVARSQLSGLKSQRRFGFHSKRGRPRRIPETWNLGLGTFSEIGSLVSRSVCRSRLRGLESSAATSLCHFRPDWGCGAGCRGPGIAARGRGGGLPGAGAGVWEPGVGDSGGENSLFAVASGEAAVVAGEPVLLRGQEACARRGGGSGDRARELGPFPRMVGRMRAVSAARRRGNGGCAR